MNRRPSKPVPLHDPKTAAQNLRQHTGAALPVFIDYEFNRSANSPVNLVSCSAFTPDWGAQPKEWWLHNRPDNVKNLVDTLKYLDSVGAVFYGYAIASEARATLVAGLDPHELRWVDLYAEWCQLTYNNVSCEYGTYYTKTGFKRFSVPPHFEKARNKGRDNNAVGRGMIDAAAQMFDLFIDSARKREMRDLIIADHDTYTPAQQSDIMAYCSDDVRYLPAMAWEMTSRLHSLAKIDFSQIGRIHQRRGAYSVSVGKMEDLGFPIRVDDIKNLRRNFALAENTLISELVEKHYPFYIRQKKRSADLVGAWVGKYDNFVQFLTEKGLTESWPKTVNAETKQVTDTFSREEKVLIEFSHIPEIKQYQEVKKQIKQLTWFKEPNKLKLEKEGDFFDSVGVDNRLRTFLGPYGTQTGRNAPKASRFILAMSSWLRCLIEPPEGYSIIGIDWGSQEFAIAAILSNDAAMMAAYESGDPYLYFAKRAGAVPEDADPKFCKEPLRLLTPHLPVGFDISHSVNDEILATLSAEVIKEFKAYKDYKGQRGLFKSCVLGLQYGMRAAKLAVKLTADVGRFFTQEEAQKLINLHEKVFKVFWAWSVATTNEYQRRGILALWDGWVLLGDNDNMLSVRNFPVQGTAQSIMREAIRLAHQRKLKVLSPLHDAVYAISENSTTEKDVETLSNCMNEAVETVLGKSLKIRLDIDVHKHGEVWLEEKGERFYKLLSPYLKCLPATGDKKNELLKTIFGG